MHILQIETDQTLAVTTVTNNDQGFHWISLSQQELAADPLSCRQKLVQLCGSEIFDLHWQDTQNLSHPSYFENTDQYQMLIFRKLALAAEQTATLAANNAVKNKGQIPPALQQLATNPVSFFIIGRHLISIGPGQCRIIEQTRQRLLNFRPPSADMQHSARLPASAQELILRLLNAMVDQYLELRHPLTQQLDRWQHALLNPRRSFHNWSALLDARLALRKLEHLCEEQHDAVQELRDHLIDSAGGQNDHHLRARELLLVRANDVIEHINRVLQHARRLEADLESAVQIHFSAMAHRTSEIMRTLTVITALFMPLTLITGIFGMNFENMPLLKHVAGFWIIMASMLVIVLALLLYFYRQRYLAENDYRASP